jgi:hypothetical protein
MPSLRCRDFDRRAGGSLCARQVVAIESQECADYVSHRRRKKRELPSSAPRRASACRGAFGASRAPSATPRAFGPCFLPSPRNARTRSGGRELVDGHTVRCCPTEKRCSSIDDRSAVRPNVGGLSPARRERDAPVGVGAAHGDHATRKPDQLVVRRSLGPRRHEDRSVRQPHQLAAVALRRGARPGEFVAEQGMPLTTNGEDRRRETLMRTARSPAFDSQHWDAVSLLASQGEPP